VIAAIEQLPQRRRFNSYDATIAQLDRFPGGERWQPLAESSLTTGSPWLLPRA
jgi:hypothetical protein